MVVSQESKDFAWVSNNLNDLQKKYAGKFIAVSHGKVIAVADNWEDIERRAKQVLTLNESFIVEFIESGDLYAFTLSKNTTD